MAWYHPELYHRVLTYSGTFVNQQWPYNPQTPHGAWEFHEHLIPDSPAKPIRIWMEVGDRDLLDPNVMRDNMHDWVLANEHMANVLAAKGYHYQFVFAGNAEHIDRAVKQQTLPKPFSISGKTTHLRRSRIDPLLAEESVDRAQANAERVALSSGKVRVCVVGNSSLIRSCNSTP